VNVYYGHGGAAGLPAEPITVNDVITQVSEPLSFAAGHPLRRASCLYCSHMAGGASVVLVSITDMRHAACECGALACACYAIHESHDLGTETDIVRLALAVFAAHHGGAARL